MFSSVPTLVAMVPMTPSVFFSFLLACTSALINPSPGSQEGRPGFLGGLCGAENVPEHMARFGPPPPSIFSMNKSTPADANSDEILSRLASRICHAKQTERRPVFSQTGFTIFWTFLPRCVRDKKMHTSQGRFFPSSREH